ncbi:MAG: DEAD/DEAH box helicase [Deltaproteobacteria bacterium]|nr:MAG: DEAD/DEAH box helicase [Deltaproteobacteria bacterium]
MSAFHRLHPRLKHAIVHDLGWRSLRPVQDLATEAILDGNNCVVLAPTAGGKTEASFFPVLSDILTLDRAAVAAIYLCPIRALLNNQESRVQSYARMVGLDAFKWHGDVAATRKRRFVGQPTHVLMTTPESLEVMLMSGWIDASTLFANLQSVIIDEVHAFAGDDRGAHLVSLLERLTAFCERDLQRIGLSATVGNPEEIGRWLQGSSGRSFRLVDPPRPRAQRRLTVDFCPDPVQVATGLAAAAKGTKSLIFVESRRQAERVAGTLSHAKDLDVFVHHSAVARADRQRAEAQFEEGDQAAIVCTSTMELGIDVGDLDRVLQIDAPATVAGFLQRIGRTGRREGAVANCSFFCQKPETLIQAIAILRLAERGWVEDVRPRRRALHVLAHQVLALSIQEGGISRHRITGWLAGASPFELLDECEVQSLIETMLARDILHSERGVLTLGRRGESLYGRQNFFELYAVFSAPPTLRVLHGKEEIGTLQAVFVQLHDPAEGPLRFQLSGRSWELTYADFGRGVAYVREADRGKPPVWLGTPTLLSLELCQEMKATLREQGPEGAWLSEHAAHELSQLRDDYDGLVEADRTALEERPDGVQWHTFAGGGINRLLAAGLMELTHTKWVTGSLSLVGRDMAMADAREAIRKLSDVDLYDLAERSAEGVSRGQVSKFQTCLPADAELRLLVDTLMDVPGARGFLEGVRVVVVGREGST